MGCIVPADLLVSADYRLEGDQPILVDGDVLLLPLRRHVNLLQNAAMLRSGLDHCSVLRTIPHMAYAMLISITPSVGSSKLRDSMCATVLNVRGEVGHPGIGTGRRCDGPDRRSVLAVGSDSDDGRRHRLHHYTRARSIFRPRNGHPGITPGIGTGCPGSGRFSRRNRGFHRKTGRKTVFGRVRLSVRYHR